MDEEKKITPGYALDLIVEQHNTEKKRLWIALLVVFIALVGTNVGWIVYENSFEDVVVSENTQDGQGVNIMTGGDVTYGAETNSNKDTP